MSSHLDHIIYRIYGRLQISDIDFHDSLMTLGLPEGHRKHLVKVYETNQSEIRQILQQSTVQPLQYHDLEWRLDVKVSCSLTLEHN